jgi:hypothetical protein
VGSYLAKSTKAGGTLAEQWDGLTWTVQLTTGQVQDVFEAVACSTPNACTAVGQGSLSDPTIARWDGTSWVSEAPVSPAGAFKTTLVGVSCPNRGVCFGIGSAEMYVVAVTECTPNVAEIRSVAKRREKLRRVLLDCVFIRPFLIRAPARTSFPRLSSGRGQ